MKRIAIAVALFCICVGSSQSSATERFAPTKHYTDEKPLDRKMATITVATAHALNSFPKGDVTATFSRGDSVVQLAERHGFLVEQITDGVVVQSGWLARYAFEDKKELAATTLHCSGRAPGRRAMRVCLRRGSRLSQRHL